MDDTIRRQDAMAMLALGCSDEKAIDIIEALPSATKTGEWTNEHEDGHGWWVGTCNQCGKENRVNNFCPSCGAYMRGAK